MPAARAVLAPDPAQAAHARAEMIAVLANMAESALAARPAREQEAGGDPRGAEGDRRSPGAGGDRIRPPVDADAGPRAHRVHAAPVRPGRAGRPAGLGRHCHQGDRCRPGPVRAHGIAPRRVQAPGRPGLPGRGRGGVRPGSLPACPLQRGPGPPAGTGPLTSTLVIDNDGVYDLSDINDRLLLGLKSQMSEAELHWLTSRMNEAKKAAARRGELRVPLPVGLVYDDDGGVAIDPDEEVAAAISDVFAAFTATGSAYGVAGAFAGRRFPRRAYGGTWAGQLRWGRLTHARAAGILRNPAYAGAYVFGRRRSRQVVSPDGAVRSSVTELPREEWEVLIRDHHPGYITWEDYLASEARLAANRTNAGARPPREGTALCQGIILCGSCGKPMRTSYHTERPRYECSHSRADHVATPLCGSVRADAIDAVAAQALLDAVAPGQVFLALEAAGEVTARRRAPTAAERARYDADRADQPVLRLAGQERPHPGGPL